MIQRLKDPCRFFVFEKQKNTSVNFHWTAHLNTRAARRGILAVAAGTIEHYHTPRLKKSSLGHHLIGPRQFHSLLLLV